ncbi:MAG: FosX/FosE/FosI family fosfomycin resistance thiol transferase [Desulfovibrio sp.]|nr:MAG: FosX/FosE/FosI family fosfomycin resistance thiol transferase [Desulfovibrio sp.]
MIEGLSHITFVVSDLERAGEFLKSIFDAEEMYASGEDTFSIAPERFYLVAGIWIAIMQGEPLTEKTYNHVALKIPDNSFEKYERRVRESGLEFRVSRPRVEGEGRSLYFYDHDNHLFELHTGTLSERLEAYERLGRE